MTRSLFQDDDLDNPYVLSTILSQERAGYNVIITEIANDILNTLEVKNLLIRLSVFEWD